MKTNTRSALEEFDGGVILSVKAQPGARKNELRGVSNGRLKVCVTQVAEKGKANKAIIKLLAKVLRIAASNITLVKGETHSQKAFRVQGLSAQELIELFERNSA